MYITNTILQNLINFLAPIVAIALVIFCVFQGVQIIRGAEGASWGKFLGGVAFILIILGIMYAAGSFESYGNAFKGVADSVINSAAQDTGNIVG